jgi:hypothetical protein
MANEKARNQQDALLNPATYTLPTTASTSATSAAIDLGADSVKPENLEIELSVPSLTSVMNPAAATAGVTYLFESSTTSTFGTVARTIISKNIAGSSGATPAVVLRGRLPSDCERYIRSKVTFGGTTADGSTLSATTTLRF